MKTKLASGMLCGFILCVGMIGAASADEAQPPIGLWYGQFSDGSGLSVLVGANGAGCYHPGGAEPVTGNWTWNPTSVGGILTLHYQRVGFRNRLYLSVTWVNPQTIILSDPYFRLTMHRR
jgi:hypothetical protein